MKSEVIFEVGGDALKKIRDVVDALTDPEYDECPDCECDCGYDE